MKENTDIDQLFEEQLADLKVEPAIDSWGKISSSLDAAVAASVKNSKRKKRFILIAFVSTIAALFAYVLFFGHSGDKNDTSIDKQHALFHQEQQLNDDQTKKRLKPEMIVQKEDNAHANENLKEKTIVTPAKQNIEPYESFVEKPITNTKSNNKQPIESNKKFDKKSTTSSIKANTKAVLNSEELVEPTKTMVSSKEDKEPKVALYYATKQAEVNSETEQKSKAVENQKQVIVAEKEVQTEEKASIYRQAQDRNSASNEKTSEVKNEKKAETLAQVDDKKKEAVAETKKNTAPSPTEVMGVYASTGWSFDIFGGPALISSNERIPMAESRMLQQTDKKSHIITPSMGLNINYHYNNWFVRSGVAYSEYGENKEYLKSSEMHDTVGYSKQLVNSYYSHDTTGWMQDPGDPSVSIPIYDAVFHSDTTYTWMSRDSLYYEHQNISAQNRYRYIEIPLMVGYELRFKNLGLELATGVSVGFRVNSSGLFIDSNRELVNINASNSPYSNTMMNYLLSIGVKYHIGNRLSVVAQPIYKTNMNSLFNSSSDVRYHNFGINLGINYIIK